MGGVFADWHECNLEFLFPWSSERYDGTDIRAGINAGVYGRAQKLQQCGIDILKPFETLCKQIMIKPGNGSENRKSKVCTVDKITLQALKDKRVVEFAIWVNRPTCTLCLHVYKHWLRYYIMYKLMYLSQTCYLYRYIVKCNSFPCN